MNRCHLWSINLSRRRLRFIGMEQNVIDSFKREGERREKQHQVRYSMHYERLCSFFIILYYFSFHLHFYYQTKLFPTYFISLTMHSIYCLFINNIIFLIYYFSIHPCFYCQTELFSSSFHLTNYAQYFFII